MSEWIVTRRDGVVFEVILNRADKRNAITNGMMDAISAAFDRAEEEFNAGARAAVIQAEGRVFSAGIDISEFQAIGRLARQPLPLHRSLSSRLRQNRELLSAGHLRHAGLLSGHGIGVGACLRLSHCCRAH